MDRTEAMIRQHLYWSYIRYIVRKEVTNCDTFQRTKLSNKKYVKLPAKLAGEIPCNKLCVDLIWYYVIRTKVKKENLNLKAVTIIDPVTGWFKILQYDDKIAITIANLVETTCLSRYPIPIEITYDQGKGFIGHNFRKSLIETECRITAKPSTLVNPMSHAILERIHQVLGNLLRTFNIQQTYVDKNDLCAGTLGAAAFVIRSTTNRQKVYIPGQLIFGYDMRLVPAQDIHFFYMRSHLSALPNCALLFSTNFQFIFIFKKFTTQFSHWIV